MNLANIDNIPTRHWNPNSETYSGGDSLLTALDNGWDIVNVTRHQEKTMGGGAVNVYRVTLQRDRSNVVMALISNPAITRIIQQHGYTITI